MHCIGFCQAEEHVQCPITDLLYRHTQEIICFLDNTVHCFNTSLCFLGMWLGCLDMMVPQPVLILNYTCSSPFITDPLFKVILIYSSLFSLMSLFYNLVAHLNLHYSVHWILILISYICSYSSNSLYISSHNSNCNYKPCYWICEILDRYIDT